MSEPNKYIPIIGMEIHVELKTNSKMFCGCKNDPFHAPKPNIYTCPVCLGLPGALPVPNKRAIEWTVMLGLALGCEINQRSRFDRKHYFYPDLPKGYQISQYDKPFCEKGEIVILRSSEGSSEPFGPELRVEGSASDINIGGNRLDCHVANAPRNDRLIRITRVHLEEDTGKLIHRTIKGKSVTLIDFNRGGVPLVEIVTGPDIRSAEEAKEYAKKIHQIVRALGISDANMEKGSMRLEANVSLAPVETSPLPWSTSTRSASRRTGCDVVTAGFGRTSDFSGEKSGSSEKLPNYKVELKNINSFRFLEKAINMEIERQTRVLENGEKLLQQTWGWDSRLMKLKLQRTKEEAADYRYFPDPDIPPIVLTDSEIKNIKSQIPKLPEEVFQDLINLGVSDQAAKIILGDKDLSGKMLQALRGDSLPGKESPQEVRGFGNWLLHHMEEAREKTAEELVKDYQKTKSEVVGDSGQLEKWVEEAMAANKEVVGDIKAGKQQAIGFLIGQVQKMAHGKANAKMVMKIIKKKLV